MSAEADKPAERIDRWLWFARFCKTRALAQKAVERGQVLLNGSAIRKTSATVRPGDKLSITLGKLRWHVKVLDTGERRGPPDEARALYQETASAERLSSEDAALPLYARIL